MTEIEFQPGGWRSLADINASDSTLEGKPSPDTIPTMEQSRRKSLFGMIKKSTIPGKERRFSKHLLSARRKSSVNYSPEKETGSSLFANFKTMVTGRRRSSVSINSRRKSSVAIIEEYENFTFLPYQLKGRIPLTIAKTAEVELGETHERKKLALISLKEMIRDSKESHNWRQDEDILIMFLRAKKYDVSRAFAMIAKFYNYKSDCYDVHPFTKHHFDVELQYDYMSLLPQRDSEGRCVGIVKLAQFDPERISLFRGFNIMMAIFANGLEDPANQITGLVLILDCKGMTYKWVKHMNTTYIKCLSYSLEAMPLRYKAIHILNENVFFKVLFKFLEVFLTQKIKNRIHHHGKDMNSLHQHVPPSILPQQYGGLDTWHPLEDVMQTDAILSPKMMS